MTIRSAVVLSSERRDRHEGPWHNAPFPSKRQGGPGVGAGEGNRNTAQAQGSSGSDRCDDALRSLRGDPWSDARLSFENACHAALN